MAFRFPFRRRSQPDQTPTAEAPAAPPAAAAPSPWLAPVRVVGSVFAALDRGFASLAVPFGVRVRDPVRRYALMLGLYTVLFVLGSQPSPGVSLPALAIAYVGVLAIGRAWVLNEKKRTAIVKKLDDADPDKLPDLRWTALVSALMLLVLFPLLFQQVQQFGLYRVNHEPTFWSWLWFTLDSTYLKALPDWSYLYNVHYRGIQFDAPWGRHLVLLTRLTFDYILIQGVLRLLAIRATIKEAVAAVKADPEMAVRLGRRAIPPLLEKLNDPDKAVRGAAANALTQLGDERALQGIVGGVKG